jgi:hypothetical protein
MENDTTDYVTISEKVAYIKGLAEGLNVKESNEGRVLSEILDALKMIAYEIEDMSERQDDTEEYILEIDEDLGDLEEYVLEDQDDELLDITCPVCDSELEYDIDEIDEDGNVKCPICGEVIELLCDCDECSDEDEEESELDTLEGLDETDSTEK